MVAFERQQGQYLDGGFVSNCSSETQGKIDVLTVQIVKEQYDEAYATLKNHESKLHDIARVLYETETLTGEPFMEILNRPALLEEGKDKLEEQKE